MQIGRKTVHSKKDLSRHFFVNMKLGRVSIIDIKFSSFDRVVIEIVNLFILGDVTFAPPCIVIDLAKDFLLVFK
jgi:hypothetical protein